MKILSKVKEAVQMSDFFYSTHMLRFEKEGEYRTLTGGLLSVVIIVVIVLGFANMIIDTLNMTNITTRTTV